MQRLKESTKRDRPWIRTGDGSLTYVLKHSLMAPLPNGCTGQQDRGMMGRDEKMFKSGRLDIHAKVKAVGRATTLLTWVPILRCTWS